MLGLRGARRAGAWRRAGRRESTRKFAFERGPRRLRRFTGKPRRFRARCAACRLRDYRRAAASAFCRASCRHRARGHRAVACGKRLRHRCFRHRLPACQLEHGVRHAVHRGRAHLVSLRGDVRRRQPKPMHTGGGRHPQFGCKGAAPQSFAFKHTPRPAVQLWARRIIHRHRRRGGRCGLSAFAVACHTRRHPACRGCFHACDGAFHVGRCAGHWRY